MWESIWPSKWNKLRFDNSPDINKRRLLLPRVARADCILNSTLNLTPAYIINSKNKKSLHVMNWAVNNWPKIGFILLPSYIQLTFPTNKSRKFVCIFSFLTSLVWIVWYYPLTPRSNLYFSLLSSIPFLWCYFREFSIGPTNYSQFDSFHYSHHLSGWYCIDIVRRNSVLVTHGS